MLQNEDWTVAFAVWVPREALAEKNQFIRDGQLDVELVLRKFVDYYTELFGDYGERFIEDDRRRLFLLYVRPIIVSVLFTKTEDCILVEVFRAGNDKLRFRDIRSVHRIQL